MAEFEQKNKRYTLYDNEDRKVVTYLIKVEKFDKTDKCLSSAKEKPSTLADNKFVKFFNIFRNDLGKQIKAESYDNSYILCDYILSNISFKKMDSSGLIYDKEYTFDKSISAGLSKKEAILKFLTSRIKISKITFFEEYLSNFQKENKEAFNNSSNSKIEYFQIEFRNLFIKKKDFNLFKFAIDIILSIYGIDHTTYNNIYGSKNAPDIKPLAISIDTAIFYDPWIEEKNYNEKLTNEYIQIISEDIRNSKTYSSTELNTLSHKNYNLYLFESGMAVYEKFKTEKFYNTNSGDNPLNTQKISNVDFFNKALVLRYLTLAYNDINEILKDKSILIHKDFFKSKRNNKAKFKMLENLYQSLYSFNLEFYFSNPVKFENYESSTIWPHFREFYQVDNLHEENSRQVSDLLNAIKFYQDKQDILRARKNATLVGAIVSVAIFAVEILSRYVFPIFGK